MSWRPRPLDALLLLCSGLLSWSCYGTPVLLYEITPAQMTDKGRLPGGYSVIRFARGTQAIFRNDDAHGFGLEVLLLDKRSLGEVKRHLEPVRGQRAAGHIPSVFPVRIHVYNRRDRAAFVDYTRFRLHNLSTGKVMKPIGPRQYLESYYGDAAFPLVYSWAFSQKDAYHFLHEIPSWFYRVYTRDSASPAERRARIEKSLQELARRQKRLSVVPPDSQVKGFVLFPQLRTGASYRLTYQPASLPHGLTPFRFNPIRFRVNLVTDADAHLPGQRRTVKSDAKSDTAAQIYLERERARVTRDLDALHAMHKQLRRHAELRSQLKAAKPKTPARKSR